MNHIKKVLGMICVVIIASGCKPSVTVAPPSQTPMVEPATPANHSVVVDLDAVVKAMNWDTLITRKVEAATANLNDRLLEAASSMEAELQQQQAALGDNPTPGQKEDFRQARIRVQQNIQNNKRIAEQARDAVRAEQILKIRQRIKPVAGQVAQEHGASVVLLSNQDVIWFDSDTDITGDIIASLRAQDQKDSEESEVVISRERTHEDDVGEEPETWETNDTTNAGENSSESVTDLP